MTKRSGSVVVIGSGPSLNRIDLRPLASCDTIAFNRSWLAWPSWGFAPTLHACLDPLSMALIGPELTPVLDAHPATRFFLHRDARQFGIGPSDRVTFSELRPGTTFSPSLSELTDFGNVGAISLQVLAILGYCSILMVGIDGLYSSDDGSANDPNHFRDDYGAGRIPLGETDRARYSAGWPLVAAECRRLGLDVRNASPGSSLTCFPQVGFAEGLDWIKGRRSDVQQSRTKEFLP